MQLWVKISQICSYPLVRLFLRLTFSQAKIYLKRKDLDKNYGYVLAANHSKRLDPFIITGSMKLPLFSRLSPIFFMTAQGFFRFLPLRIYLRSMGSFPTREVYGMEYGLPFSIKTLAEKGTIFVFPEGRRVDKEPVRAHTGVGLMATEPNVRVILCRIKWRKPAILGVKVIISKPRDYQNAPAQQILDDIYSLN